jgi:hypothetical protein
MDILGERNNYDHHRIVSHDSSLIGKIATSEWIKILLDALQSLCAASKTRDHNL